MRKTISESITIAKEIGKMSEKTHNKIDKITGEDFTNKSDEQLRRKLPKELKKAIIIAHPHLSAQRSH